MTQRVSALLVGLLLTFGASSAFAEPSLFRRLTEPRVRAEAKLLADVRREAEAAGLPPERIETMCRMNAHYDAHGLTGNPNVLRWLLGRPATTFRDFVRRELLAR